jgi:hypothetical protein
MRANFDELKDEISALVEEANPWREALLSDSGGRQIEETFKPFYMNYEQWYSKSLAVVKIVLPDRTDDFMHCYSQQNDDGEVKIDKIGIRRYLTDILFQNINQHFASRATRRTGSLVQMQIGILDAAFGKFDSKIYNIQETVTADLFDSELSAARELNKQGHHRAAGVVAGVLLEKHLRRVAEAHGLSTTKKNPTISVWNDLLKENGVIEIPRWREIQHFGDLRNLCGHDKEKEPTGDDVTDLIEGVDKIMKLVH